MKTSSEEIKMTERQENIFRHIDAVEESHGQLTKLIDRLDQDTRAMESSEVHQLISGMEGMLGQVTDNHYEMQREIEELLESSRRGVLSHDKLTEMVGAEQVRTQYLVNIVSSLKTQIEGLFNKLITATDDEEVSKEPAEIVEQVSDNMNLLWKSVDSLSKIITSPTKKLEYNIQKIESEVIVHLNKTLHLHDKQQASNPATLATVAESFPSKVENQLKVVRNKKIERKNSSGPTNVEASKKTSAPISQTKSEIPAPVQKAPEIPKRAIPPEERY